MEKTPPLILVEPTSRRKQYRLAQVIHLSETEFGQRDLKLQLRQLRSDSVDNMIGLVERFCRSVANYSNIHVKLAENATETIDYIAEIIPEVKTIAMSKSGTVDELRPELEKRGYTLIDTYSLQFSDSGEKEKMINFPWQLPAIIDESAWDTFDCTSDAASPMPDEGVKDIVAMLGANAASAEDGSVFFLQHSGNIGTMLRQAKKLLLVIGIEKIVPTRSDAFFQTKCAGAFGMESIILDLKIGSTDQETKNQLSEMPEAADSAKELHIILLDNGRTSIAKGDYKELLQCISCRACLKQCSGYRYLKEFDYYPQQYLWSFLLGYNPSIESCAYCARCQIECPTDIKLPQLIAKAKADYSPRIARLRDNQVLMNMTKLAPLGSLVAPLINRFSRIKLLRVLIEKISGIDRRRTLPNFHYVTFKRWFRSRHV